MEGGREVEMEEDGRGTKTRAGRGGGGSGGGVIGRSRASRKSQGIHQRVGRDLQRKIAGIDLTLRSVAEKR